MPIPKPILAYNASQSPTDKRICTTLAKAIDRHLPNDPEAPAKAGGTDRSLCHRPPL